ncbi:cellulose biosynthesis cyclic di-GMP-binding regulatory protein BcsB [Bacillus sp. ISL-51]|uniref:cellulose biosynthesis cyclic di-GMP-binding regulatory protein BcsB n=1 Tax=Bacteria TaxID=2 RepID=UPI001BEB0410|nr:MULTISPECIES: cellulose biosynthesis cyclic di-GMP-binding regulatory protein BcsB [Bacteria]MBT2573182.1 cellulose biosynthesis cyclic di-GMP-binding regulatory protein BcsB [Bacillus sp. ISL-51]MBT2635085.1 cellulose biosynthesis cyclic di-GMP-binding regulatory protein BcsB [Bacillus sp. ISL-26]MBT2711994.1 cellulose biosynthesis cyclic di-GMP-binding regulatory protein BcsB [Pseudomonas sp. ISL-88]
MKKAIILITGLLLLAVNGEPAAAQELKTDGSILGKSISAKDKQQALTSDLITLYGAKDSSQLTYQIPAGASDANQSLVIDYEASNLLISPSSLTIAIDHEPAKSIKLDGDAKRKSVKLNLSKSQSAQGYHNVSLNFYGVLKEGVCVRQDTSGNWIKIYPDSRLMLSETSKSKGADLSHFPYPFAQSGNTGEETDIIIPDKPSSAEVEAAVKTEGFLKTADSKLKVSYVKESDAAKIDNPSIVIGTDDHWNGNIKELFKQGNIKAEENKLLLAERVLTAKDKRQPVLFVTAKSDEPLANKISVITDKTYTGQLGGATLMIDRLQPAAEKTSNKLTLEDFGAGDVTVGSNKTSSEHFFYPALAVVDKDGQIKLSLKLKTSEAVQTKADDSGSEKAELNVMINGQPNAVRLHDLGNKDKDGFYHVSLPVDPKLLQSNRYIDLQFVTSGLKENNPCIDHDENKWVYIDKSSTLSYPVSDTAQKADFEHWPLPFADNQKEKTVMVIPDGVSMRKLEELSLLIDSFGNSAQQSFSFTVKTASEMKEADAKGHNVLFIGGLQQFPLLKAKASELIVPSDRNGTYNVSEFQMLNETTKQIAFTQKSPWDGDYSIAVFAPLSGSGTAVTKELISFLDSSSEAATVINETNSQQLFSNHQQIKSDSSGQSAGVSNPASKVNVMYIVLFAALIIIAAVLIWYTSRRKKRKADNEKNEG